MVIPSLTEVIMLFILLNFFDDCNFLFYLSSISQSLIFFSHLFDRQGSKVLACNNSNQHVQILYKLWFNIVSKVYFKNYYYFGFISKFIAYFSRKLAVVKAIKVMIAMF